MAHSMLKRHESGSVSHVSGYVGACYDLKADAIAQEFSDRLASAPTRASGYIVDHNIEGRRSETQDGEVYLAYRLCEAKSRLLLSGWATTEVVDYQTPLNANLDDGYGKIDVLGVGDGLCVIELKVLGGDTPLNALLEGTGYCAPVVRNYSAFRRNLAAKGHEVGSDRVSILVLAPDDYWARWDRTRKTQDWRSALRTAASTITEATGFDIAFGSFMEEDVGPTVSVSHALS